MSEKKAIAKFPMPHSCEACPMFNSVWVQGKCIQFCWVTRHEITAEIGEKNEDCPLEEVEE